MAMGNLHDAITAVDLFATLDRDTVDALIQAGATIRYAPGSTVVEQGSLGGGLQLFLDGGGEVVVNGERRRTLGVGDYFGEMTLFDASPRSATIVAGDAGAQTFTLSPMSVGAVLDANPKAARKVMAALAKRVREVEALAAGKD